LQVLLEPRDRLGVEVVGGLVEQEEVGAHQQRAAERDATLLATREVVDALIRGRKAQRVHRDLERGVEVPAIAGVDEVLELALLVEELVHVGVGLTHRHADRLEARERVAHRLDGLVHDVDDRAVLADVGLLRDEAHGRRRPDPRLAGEVLVLARHDAEQGALAHAVRPDDADLRAGDEGQVEVLDDLLVGRVDLGHALHREDVVGHREVAP
jgi:hypothetical protein